MVYLSSLYKEFGEKIVFNKIDLAIYDGEKIGIIGDNGVGKSTLLNIISNIDADYSGVCDVDGSIAYLKQSSFTDFDALTGVLADTQKSRDFFRSLKQMNFDGDINNLSSLSCGERTKVAFALAYVESPQILILDEPTNHLDLTGREVIINIINSFDGTVIVVSHDVDFLNQVVYKIVEIADGKICEYAGNFDNYLEEKRRQRLAQERAYEAHTKKVRDIKENIDVVRRFAQKAERDVGKQGGSPSDSRLMNTKTSAMQHAKKLAQGIASNISRLEKEIGQAPDKPKEIKEIKYRFDVNPLRSKIAVKIEDVEFGYPNKNIFQNMNFEVLSGDKVGIIGDNGVGKSTLIKLICGKLAATKGVIRRVGILKIVSMEQDIYDLDENKTIEELSRGGDAEYRTLFITNLINMNIDKSRFNTKIKNLSLGERMRIKLNFIILSDANFIILDEPTNHLDIANKEFMRRVLREFKGTILIVSHDIDFIHHTCDKVYKVADKKIQLSN